MVRQPVKIMAGVEMFKALAKLKYLAKHGQIYNNLL